MTTASERQRSGSRGLRVQPAMAWRSWPLRDDWRHASQLLALAICLGLVVFAVSGKVYLGAVALVAVCAAEWWVWIPTYYEMNARGIHLRIRRQRRLPWHAVRRCRIREEGILIFLREGQPWDVLEALRIPWPRQRAELEMLLEHYLGGRQLPGNSTRSIERTARTQGIKREPAEPETAENQASVSEDQVESS